MARDSPAGGRPTGAGPASVCVVQAFLLPSLSGCLRTSFVTGTVLGPWGQACPGPELGQGARHAAQDAGVSRAGAPHPCWGAASVLWGGECHRAFPEGGVMEPDAGRGGRAPRASGAAGAKVCWQVGNMEQ